MTLRTLLYWLATFFYGLYSINSHAINHDITPSVVKAFVKVPVKPHEPLLSFYAYLGTPYVALKQHLLSLCLVNVTQQPDRITCEKYPFLAQSIKVTARQNNKNTNSITLMFMRDYMAELISGLTETYGKPTKRTVGFAYFKQQGICADFANASVSISSVANTLCTDKNAQVINPLLTPQQWLADLNAFDQIIRQYHVTPFWLNSSVRYQAVLKEAEHYLQQGNIESDIAFAYFEKMLALMADGHAYIANKTTRFGALPIRFAWFGDDLVITHITSQYGDVLGATVTHIDDKPINQVLTLIKPYVPAINASGFKSSTQIALRFIGLLYAANITQQSDATHFSVKLQNGDTIKFPLYKNKAGTHTRLVAFTGPDNNDNALSCQTSNKRQCVEYLPQYNAVYFRYQSVTEANAGDIQNSSDEMSALIHTHNAQRLIVDVRNNEGGNSYLNSYLLNAIIQNRAINQPGKLYLLTNHNTFSAAVNFTGALAMNSHAIIVGQPVGDAPIFPGEAGPQAIHVLPNSNALVSLSFSAWQATFSYDQQLTIPVDIPVTNSIDTINKGSNDAVLKRALTHMVSNALLPVSKQASAQWVGRYDYSHDKALIIASHNNQLRLTVEGEIIADLYSVSDNRLALSTGQLFIEKQGNKLVLFQGSKIIKQLSRLAPNERKPLELLLQGEFAQAKIAYQAIYKSMPHYLPISGNNLGLLASKLSVKYNNKRLYQQLRDIAITLHGYPINSWQGANSEVK